MNINLMRLVVLIALCVQSLAMDAESVPTRPRALQGRPGKSQNAARFKQDKTQHATIYGSQILKCSHNADSQDPRDQALSCKLLKRPKLPRFNQLATNQAQSKVTRPKSPIPRLPIRFVPPSIDSGVQDGLFDSEFLQLPEPSKPNSRNLDINRRSRTIINNKHKQIRAAPSVKRKDTDSQSTSSLRRSTSRQLTSPVTALESIKSQEYNAKEQELYLRNKNLSVTFKLLKSKSGNLLRQAREFNHAMDSSIMKNALFFSNLAQEQRLYNRRTPFRLS